MKKILFGITGLTIGGAERVLVDIANQLSDKYDITIFTIYAKGELENQLNEKIKIKSLVQKQYERLSKMQKIKNIIKILIFKKYIYNKYIKGDYNIEIAFLEGPITRLFSSKNNAVYKIAWVHNDISLVFGRGIKGNLKKYLDKIVYSKYKQLIFVSKDNEKKFNQTYTNIYNKHKVIYNYINKDDIIEKSKEKINFEFPKERVNFLTIARLVTQKGIDRIVDVHSKLIRDGYNHNFYVIGAGPEESKLLLKIKELNLEGSFKLLGKIENPYPYIKESDYFCLLSYFEGYGMVIEEAKILNKHILITDTAAREAIFEYNNKSIVENSEEGIYYGIKELVEEKNKNTQKNIHLEYNNKHILETIIELLEE